MNGRHGTCIGCGAVAPLGALLDVIPHSSLAARYRVHRPGIDVRCFQLAGIEQFAAIAFADATGAREFDRIQATPGTAIHA